MIFNSNKCNCCVIQKRTLNKELCNGCYDTLNDVWPYLRLAIDYKPIDKCFI